MKKEISLLALVVLLSACAPVKEDTSVGVGGEDSKDTKGVYEIAMPHGKEAKYDDPGHGKEVWFAIGPLNAVEEKPANGVAQSHYYQDRTYRLTAQLNIDSADDGYFYEGWLVDPDSGEFISTGPMSNHFGDTRHYANFEVRRDLKDYTKVVITVEPDDGDPAPAEHIAEGLLKRVRR